jgi:hypothetical protein
MHGDAESVGSGEARLVLHLRGQLAGFATSRPLELYIALGENPWKTDVFGGFAVLGVKGVAGGVGFGQWARGTARGVRWIELKCALAGRLLCEVAAVDNL